MKVVKSLLLGTAAGLIAVGGAQAADLPVKAKAVEYVKICSLYGAGFYYIPGSDTSIKLGGYRRPEVALNAGGNNFDQLVGGSGTTNGVTQFTYTADFGQGVTAAFSAQDATQVFQTNIWNTAGMSTSGVLGGAYGSNDLGGSRSPDLVGMVRV